MTIHAKKRCLVNVGIIVLLEQEVQGGDGFFVNVEDVVDYLPHMLGNLFP